MNIIIVYASNSGGTFISSNIIAENLKKLNHQVTVSNVRETEPGELSKFDCIIFGSPSWDYQGKEGQLHQDFLPFLEKAKGLSLPGKKFAAFGLGDSSFAYFTGAVSHLEKFIGTLGGKPIQESLRIDGFFFDQETNEKKIQVWAENLSTVLTKSASVS